MSVTTALVSARATSSISGSITMSNGSIQIGAQSLPTNQPTISYTTGTGSAALQANKIATITGSVTSGTPVSIDLNALADASVVNPLQFTGVRAFRVWNTGTTAANVLLVGDASGSTSNAWHFGQTATTQNRVGAGGYFEQANGNNGDLPAVSPTAKLLILDAAAGTTTYQIDLIGY